MYNLSRFDDFEILVLFHVHFQVRATQVEMSEGRGVWSRGVWSVEQRAEGEGGTRQSPLYYLRAGALRMLEVVGEGQKKSEKVPGS